MIAAEHIAAALGGRRSGEGWIARCPAHEDREPSLSLAERDGHVLVRCHAGCAQHTVIDALRARGLWESAPRGNGHAPPRAHDRHADAAARAREIWDAAAPASDDHPYLTAHGVRAHGLRIYRGDLVLRGVRCDGALIVPLRDAGGSLITCQLIGADGAKRYLAGGRTAGAYHAIGEAGDTIVIVEGYATGAAVHEATGWPVRCAMSAANLLAIARLVRERAPAARLIIAGDHDESGTGQRAAAAAAQAVGGLVALPTERGTDWADVLVREGPQAVRAGLEAASAPDGAASAAVAADPTPLVRPIPPAAPYPTDALGPVLAPAARAIAEIVQVPDALAAGCVLATAALAAQAHANVQTLGGARPLSLYVLTVAQSGDRKTAADDVALAPVREYERRMTVTYREQLAEWERAAAARKLDRSLARKGAESGDDYAAALAGIEDEPRPRAPWLISSDPTCEGLVRSLADGEYAQGIYTDEGGQILGGHAMSEESELRTIALLSRLWGGARIDRVRSTDREHLVLYGRRLSIHLLAQPEVAARMLGSALYRGQGMLARWLIAAPESLAGTRLHDASRPAPQEDPRLRRYVHAISELLTRPPVEDREVGGLNPPCLALSPEARRLLVAAYDEIERAQAPEAELAQVRDWAAKAAEHACRIAGVLTLIAEPAAPSVSAEAMAGALRLTEHYLSEYDRLVGAAAIPERVQRAQRLLEWLRAKRHETITRRRILQYGPGAIRSIDAVKEALAVLEEHGWVALGEDGRTYAVHPAALREPEP